jgi:hypothetical protein
MAAIKGGLRDNRALRKDSTERPSHGQPWPSMRRLRRAVGPTQAAD